MLFKEIRMPALLINVKIDRAEVFDLFKVTLSEISNIFDERHIKIRGVFAKDCIEHAKQLFGSEVQFYQELQETDWVEATLEILNQVKSRSIFFYLEDHRLVAPLTQFASVLKEFDDCQMDYLCYSFFRASCLDTKNILPLNPTQHLNFHAFEVNEGSARLIGKISKKYFIFSMASIVSVEYFRAVLEVEHKKIKIHQKQSVSLLSILFPYPKYRKILNRLNILLSKLNIRLCIYPSNSPHNIEKAWYEYSASQRPWIFGVLDQELLANFDDDNGQYGESLIKRGRYPFESCAKPPVDGVASVSYEKILSVGEKFDCTYHSQTFRIRIPPQVGIEVLYGELNITYGSMFETLSGGSIKFFYTNLSPIVEAKQNSKMKITIYDTDFS